MKTHHIHNVDSKMTFLSIFHPQIAPYNQKRQNFEIFEKEMNTYEAQIKKKLSKIFFKIDLMCVLFGYRETIWGWKIDKNEILESVG